MKAHWFVWTAVFAAQQALAAAPIDEFRLSSIEQSIRALQTQVSEQARLISELQRQAGVAVSPQAAPAVRSPATAANQTWLNAANWKRLRNGMSELEVVSILGPPTQMRASDDKSTRTLFYALEIGNSGFLTGNVVFSDGDLTTVNTPALK